MSILLFSKFLFSSVAQSCPTLCEPMNCSTPGLPVHHHLLEFTQTHVHWVGDGQGGLACCDLWGRKELDTTEWLNWTELNLEIQTFLCRTGIRQHAWKMIRCCCHSVTELCPTPCDPMDCSTPLSSILHCLPELAQIHVHWVGDAIQPSHHLSPASPAFSFS